MPAGQITKVYDKNQRLNKRGRGRPPKNKGNVSQTVKKYVNNRIHANIQNKHHILSAHNNNITGPQFVLSLMPTLNTGTGESQRTGNMIRLMSAKISFIVNMIPYVALTNPYGGPIHFRYIVLSQRTDNKNVLDLTRFFETNNNAQTIAGNHLNQLLPINDELYKVHKSGRFRLGNTAQSNNFPVAGSNFDNSKLSIYKKINIGKYCNKKLRFDDSSTNLPSNFNLWMIILVSYANGSSVDSFVLSNISYVVEHYYENA